MPTTYQTQQNAWMAYKVQSALGTAASGSGGAIFRQTGGAGGNVSRAQTESGEVRRDGQSTRGRLGTQKTNGAWNGEANLGGIETILEAIMRDTWAAALSLTQSDFTSLAIASNVITLGSGDPRTLGLRVGDVIRLSGMTQSANNSKNLRITGLTGTTITIASGDTLTDETADTTCGISRPKKLTMTGTPLKRYFTIDEYFQDMDLSCTYQDFMFGMAKLNFAANGIIGFDISGAGTGQFATPGTGSSPVLTSPSEGTSIPLAVVDATIRVNGTDVVELSSLDLTLDIRPSAPDVFGSGAIKYAPDVFAGELQIGLGFTALRKDLQRLTDFAAETVYTAHILAVENESEPKDFLSAYLGNFTLGSVQRSALSKQGGAMTETIQIPPALVGVDNTGTGYDASMIKFQSTAA